MTDGLDELARVIHAEHAHVVRGVEAKFAIGRALLAARALLPSTQAYGAWFKSQGFGFGIRTGHNYSSGADLEARVRAHMARAEKLSGRPIGFTEALRLARTEGADGIRSRQPARSARRRAPRQFLAWLIAAGDLNLRAADSDDPVLALAEREKALNVLAFDVAARRAALGVTPLWSEGA